jgi:four helix bundle protein
MTNKGEVVLYRKYFEMIKLLNIYLNHFPKHEKYALANRIRDNAYEVYDLIVECQKRYYKKTTLTQLDISHEKLRMQLYLANELDYFNYKDGRKGKINQNRYLSISRLIDEIGKLIGAWIAKLKQDGNFK